MCHILLVKDGVCQFLVLFHIHVSQSVSRTSESASSTPEQKLLCLIQSAIFFQNILFNSLHLSSPLIIPQKLLCPMSAVVVLCLFPPSSFSPILSSIQHCWQFLSSRNTSSLDGHLLFCYSLSDFSADSAPTTRSFNIEIPEDSS